MTYQMKDLRYERTPTAAMYRVEMSDGSRWDVPVQAIADSRDEHYEEDDEDTIGLIRDGSLDSSEIADWAGNNMNWSDVKEFATMAPRKIPEKIDWEDGWANGEKELIGEI